MLKYTNTDPIPVAIYCRVSSDRQDIQNSISGQSDECIRYAKAHHMVVVATYTDEAASGRISSRPGFQQMISDATGTDARFRTILVWKLSRFSRDLFDSVTYQAVLEQRGVQLISITEPIDASPAGKMIRGMIQTINAFYSDTLSEDVRRGLRKLIQRKFYPHNRAPYGLKLVKVKDEGDDIAHSKLEQDPPYSKIVRRIFLEAIAGRSDTDIRNGLHADSIPSPKGKEWWPASTIDTILNKIIYAGYIEWGVSSKSGDEPLLVPDCHEGIVTPEEYELAQKSRASRTKTTTHPRQAGSEHMLSDLLRCKKCHRNLQVRPTRYPYLDYYICKTRRQNGVAVCDCPNLSSQDFEPRFLEAVTEDILSPSNMEAIIGAISDELKVPYEEQTARLALIDKEIIDAEERQARVMTAYEAGAYTVEDYSKRIAPLRKLEADLRGKKAEAAKDMDRDAAIVANPKAVIDFAKDVPELIRHSQPKERRQLLKRFIRHVWIQPGKATIVYRIPLPGDGPNPSITKRELALDGEPGSVRPIAHLGPHPRGCTRRPDPAGDHPHDSPAPAGLHLSHSPRSKHFSTFPRPAGLHPGRETETALLP